MTEQLTHIHTLQGNDQEYGEDLCTKECITVVFIQVEKLAQTQLSSIREVAKILCYVYMVERDTIKPLKCL